MSGIFITGTDTEVGKTVTSTQLIRLLVDEGMKVAVMKPVASGAKKVAGILKNDDALSLMQASNLQVDYEMINPYVFESAIAPHIAAQSSGIEIELDNIQKKYLQLQKVSDVVVVEGVGGWYSPLSMHSTASDLAEALSLPVILVVGLRLGCLNHALLTVQAIRQSGLKFAGWIANHIDNEFSSGDETIKTLQHYLHDISYLGTLPFYKKIENKHYSHTLNKQLIINGIN